SSLASQVALTEREMEILTLIGAGRTNQEIAAELVVAHSTVKWYVNSLYRKLGAKSRVQALKKARELGLIG
ncbi:MAG: response regulator transcription factor, partial [Anaerolineales bacterium]|nr:response regulator transcription factor [Anaerolineales bacterium]